MNRSQGHWPLFDVLTMSINLTLVLKVEMGHVIDFLMFLMSLMLKFSSFKITCNVEVVKMIKFFLQILKVYDSH
jgi:hypothetical protein